jgi:hypothetical protein
MNGLIFFSSSPINLANTISDGSIKSDSFSCFGTFFIEFLLSIFETLLLALARDAHSGKPEKVLTAFTRSCMSSRLVSFLEATDKKTTVGIFFSSYTYFKRSMM